MVEYTYQLDSIFGSLSDPIRRDIVDRVSAAEYSVGELVALHDVSFAAISKHLKVLESAGLIRKRKAGKKHMISLAPGGLQSASQYLSQYQQAAVDRFDRLDSYLKEER